MNQVEAVATIFFGISLALFVSNLSVENPWPIGLSWVFLLCAWFITLVPIDTNKENGEDYQKIFEEMEELEEDFGRELDTEQKINIMMSHIQHIEKRREER